MVPGGIISVYVPAGQLELTGQISGTGGLVMTGSSTLVLAGTNAYSGGTTISQGVIVLASQNAAENTTIAVNSNNGLQFAGGVGLFNVGSLSGRETSCSPTRAAIPSR